jgi:hypothetical protein
MTDKSTPAGWVVQAAVPAVVTAPRPDAVRWIGPAMLGAPSFKYFNAAIAAPAKAIEAVTKHIADAGGSEGEMSVVRGLSAAEIAALNLKAGQIKPA